MAEQRIIHDLLDDWLDLAARVLDTKGLQWGEGGEAEQLAAGILDQVELVYRYLGRCAASSDALDAEHLAMHSINLAMAVHELLLLDAEYHAKASHRQRKNLELGAKSRRRLTSDQEGDAVRLMQQDLDKQGSARKSKDAAATRVAERLMEKYPGLVVSSKTIKRAYEAGQ